MSLEEIGTLSALVSETLKGMRIIRAFGKERIHSEKASSIIDNVVSLSMKGVKARSASAPIMEMVTGFAIAGIIYYAGSKSLDGFMSVGSFMAFTTAAGLLYDPLKAVANLQAMLQEGVAASQRLFPILDNKPKIISPDKPLEIKPGQTAALVGPSGAGKSSLLNLVPRFYDVHSGSVLLDDYDLRNLSLSNVRSASSLVSQDALIFDISIKENIIFGCDGISDEIFLKVCKDSLVDDFVKDLPDKYLTLVGESGVRLSGGQKQRIAIARAMIKDAPILLLDEATSSLDSESEKKVQEALDKLMRDKTALIVAHRLSTIKNVDVIYVIDNGAIVEQGTHKELVDKNGLYAFLFKTQFLGDKVE